MQTNRYSSTLERLIGHYVPDPVNTNAAACGRDVPPKLALVHEDDLTWCQTCLAAIDAEAAR